MPETDRVDGDDGDESSPSSLMMLNVKTIRTPPLYGAIHGRRSRKTSIVTKSSHQGGVLGVSCPLTFQRSSNSNHQPPQAPQLAMAIGKTVLITGSSRGIGLATAEHYVQQGWNVIAAARSPDTADGLKALSPYKIVQLDAADEASVLRAAEELNGEAIDLLINNAGIGAMDDLQQTTKASLIRHFEVNAVGPLLVTRAFLPHLRAAVAARGSATVAQISSTLGSISTMLNGGGLYGYRVSKAALNMVTTTLAHDLKDDKIAFIVLNPGYVQTDMSSHAGLITPQESVASFTKLIAEAKQEDTVKFYDYDGTSIPW